MKKIKNAVCEYANAVYTDTTTIERASDKYSDAQLLDVWGIEALLLNKDDDDRYRQYDSHNTFDMGVC